MPTLRAEFNLVNSRLLRVIGIALVGVMIVLAFLIPLPGRSLLDNAIQNALHTLAFAVFAFALDRSIARAPYIVNRYGNSGTPLLAVLLGSTLLLGALAFLTELIQPSTGRSYSTEDILRDFLGIAIGHIAFLLYRPSVITKATRFTLGFALLALTLLGVSQIVWVWYLSTTKPAWPMLADFEHARSLTFVRSNGIHNIKRVSAPTNWRDNRSEVIRIVKDSTPYSGFSLFDFEPDWRSLSHFKFDVFNPENHTVELNLRINDTQHNNQYLDRFNRVFPLAPGASSITFTIDEVLTLGEPHNEGRTMDISAISSLGFFMTTDYVGDTLYLDNIRGQ